MNKDEYHFELNDLEGNLELLLQKKITQVTVTDPLLTSNKNKLLSLLSKINTNAPQIHFSFYIDIQIIDKETVFAFSKIFCSLQVILKAEYLQNEKKNFSRKIKMLNDMGLVFGFDIDCALFPSIKSFKMMVDEFVTYYPNHVFIDLASLKPSEILSTQDIKKIENVSFAIEVFYSQGRAVPWFMAALQPLKIHPFQFFCDFSEWQSCNNCSLQSNFDLTTVKHSEIEKMQLLFLKIKYEERHLQSVYLALLDLVKIQGAFSRADSDNETTILDLSYNPEDILSPFAMDLLSFTDEVCLETTKVKIFPTDDGPDLKIL